MRVHAPEHGHDAMASQRRGKVVCRGERNGLSTGTGSRTRVRIPGFQVRGMAVLCAERRRRGSATGHDGEGSTATEGSCRRQGSGFLRPRLRKVHRWLGLIGEQGKEMGAATGWHELQKGGKQMWRCLGVPAGLWRSGVTRWRVEAGGSWLCRENRSAGVIIQRRRGEVPQRRNLSSASLAPLGLLPSSA